MVKLLWFEPISPGQVQLILKSLIIGGSGCLLHIICFFLEELLNINLTSSVPGSAHTCCFAPLRELYTHILRGKQKSFPWTKTVQLSPRVYPATVCLPLSDFLNMHLYVSQPELLFFCATQRNFAFTVLCNHLKRMLLTRVADHLQVLLHLPLLLLTP